MATATPAAITTQNHQRPAKRPAGRGVIAPAGFGSVWLDGGELMRLSWPGEFRELRWNSTEIAPAPLRRPCEAGRIKCCKFLPRRSKVRSTHGTARNDSQALAEVDSAVPVLDHRRASPMRANSICPARTLAGASLWDGRWRTGMSSQFSPFRRCGGAPFPVRRAPMAYGPGGSLISGALFSLSWMTQASRAVHTRMAHEIG